MIFSETPNLLISQKRKQPSQLSSFTFPCSRGRLANGYHRVSRLTSHAVVITAPSARRLGTTLAWRPGREALASAPDLSPTATGRA